MVGFGTTEDHFCHILGPRRRWYAPVYRGDMPAGSAAATHVVDAIMDADLSAMPPEQLDHLRRTLSAALAAVTAKSLSGTFDVRAWRGRGPGMDRFGMYHQGWHDHLSRLIHREDKRVYYRSEPYSIENEGITRLAELAQSGWQVKIDAGWSTHFPGYTTAVIVSRTP